MPELFIILSCHIFVWNIVYYVLIRRQNEEFGLKIVPSLYLVDLIL